MITGRLLTFLSTLVLARVLMPDEFGLVAYALLVLSFFDTLKTVHLASALIYRQDDPEGVASEIFVLAIVSASVCYALCWVIAPIAAAFFHSDQIILAIRVLGLTLLIDALGEVHIGLLQKDMRFGLRQVPRFALHVTKGLVSVVLALEGFGFWSLIWGQLAGSAVSLVACWCVCPWRPRLRFGWTSARASLKYGLGTALIGLLGMAALNTGSVIVGRMLGDAALGMYDLAMTLPQMLVLYAAVALSQVAFPALSRLQADRDGLRRGFLVIQRYSALILLPVGLGLCVVTPAFVHAVYTPVWWPMVPVMQAMAVFTTVSVLRWTTGDVFKATARLDLQWKLDLMYLVTLVPVLVMGGMLGGTLGVGIAHVVAVAPFPIVSFWVVHRLVGVSFAEIRDALQVAVLGSLLMVAGCLLAESLCRPYLEPWALLVLQITLGAAIYGATVLLLDSDVRDRVQKSFAARIPIAEPTPVRATPPGQQVG
jgi:PST family polysaccharide transporter